MSQSNMLATTSCWLCLVKWLNNFFSYFQVMNAGLRDLQLWGRFKLLMVKKQKNDIPFLLCSSYKRIKFLLYPFWPDPPMFSSSLLTMHFLFVLTLAFFLHISPNRLTISSPGMVIFLQPWVKGLARLGSTWLVGHPDKTKEKLWIQNITSSRKWILMWVKIFWLRLIAPQQWQWLFGSYDNLAGWLILMA